MVLNHELYPQPSTVPRAFDGYSAVVLPKLKYAFLTFAIFSVAFSWMDSSFAESKDAPGPYAKWSNGPSSDPNYFPIGVWLQDPKNAQRYQKAGINLYVGLWKGPTEKQLNILRANKMQVICYQNEVGLKHIDDPTIIAWMHVDEPDNAQRQPGSYWNEVPPNVIVERYNTMRSNDSSRPVWLNLGQGVTNDEWAGRAADFVDYPIYLQGADIASFDVYPVSGIRKQNGEKYLWYVARGIDRLLRWTNYTKPVWNIIETTRIKSRKGPTPQQVEAEVWMSLIHGSKGIVYFAHEWKSVV